jgi:glycosyltransferase involved in cell wall biosynthesis
MRVVLDARVATHHFPGIGRVALELGRAMARLAAASGDEVKFLVPPGLSRGAGRLPEGQTIECDTSPFSPAQHVTVPRLLERAGADVYHSLFYLMPWRPGRPTVLTCMDAIPLVRPETQPAWKRAAFALAHRVALARADQVIAISESTRRDLGACLGADVTRVRVVAHGADDRFEPPAPGVLAALRERLALPRPYLLYVGSNKPHKNLVRLVAAFARIAVARPGLDLVVAGPWDARYPETRAEAATLGLGERVRFLGPVADLDLPVLLGGAIGFAFPSLHEGFGLPVLEAMRTGTAVVASATSSLPEVVGDAGLLVDPLDVEAIAAGLARLTDDEALRAELSRRGRERALGFTWERAARAHLDADRAALEARR